MCFDALKDGTGDASIPSLLSDEHPPDFGCFLVKRSMGAHANRAFRGEGDKVDTLGRCWPVRRHWRKRIVELRVERSRFKGRFVKQGQGFRTERIAFADGEMHGSKERGLT